MQSKRKGFTLIELLVAVACASIVLGTLFTSMFFISKMNSNIISSSSNLYKIGSLQDHILNNYKDGDIYTCVEGDIYYNGEEIISNTLITVLEFQTDEHTVCHIAYDEKDYSFIVRMGG